MKPSKISMIVALSQNNQIGINNKMPWHIPEDLEYFKRITMGHTIIMGRKTYESIGRALPNRKNIILTHNHSLVFPGISTLHSVEDVLNLATQEQDEIFIIGGGEIYNLFLPYADRLYITQINAFIEGDTTFPEYKHLFKQTSLTPGKKSTPYTYTFTQWIRN